jgi:glycosyltransferase involved in cell wall biosynthesis
VTRHLQPAGAREEGLDVVLVTFTEKWWDWTRDGFAGRTACLARALAGHAGVRRLLVCDAPTSIARSLSRSRRPSSAVAGIPGLAQAEERVFVLDQTRLLPRDRHSPLAASINGVLHDGALLARLRASAEALGMRRPVVWLAGPTVAACAEAFDDRVLVYDAVDEWLAHPSYARLRGPVRRGYARIAREADLVFAVSPLLAARFEGGAAEVVVLPNAVPGLPPADAAPEPAALRGIPHPRFGYVGALQDRLDVGLLEKLATRMPEASFVLVGPVVDEAHVAPLRALGNVRFLGRCRAEEVPAHLAHIDACILPHVDSALTRNMDPVKLYEYVASGKPVVSADLPGIVQPAELVRRANGVGEWARYLELAASGEWRPSPQSVAEYVARNTWDARVDTAVERIARTAEATRRAATASTAVQGRWCRA